MHGLLGATSTRETEAFARRTTHTHAHAVWEYKDPLVRINAPAKTRRWGGGGKELRWRRGRRARCRGGKSERGGARGCWQRETHTITWNTGTVTHYPARGRSFPTGRARPSKVDEQLFVRVRPDCPADQVLVFGVAVKVGCVAVGADVWHVRRRQLPLGDLFPVEPARTSARPVSRRAAVG